MANRLRRIIGIMGKLLLGILVIFILMVSVWVMVSLVKKNQQASRNKTYKENYLREINAYLEKKYNKKFRINPDFLMYSGSPIPGSNSHSPLIFEAWEKEAGDGFVFNVWLHTMSNDDYQIKDFEDNYCWKFFNIKIKERLEAALSGVLPREYKLASRLRSSQHFDESVRPDSPLEYYFETENFSIPLLFFLIIPPSDIAQENGMTYKIVEKAIKDFHSNYPKTNITFIVVQTDNMESYEGINVKNLENDTFYLRREMENIWEIEGIEEKIRIEIGEMT